MDEPVTINPGLARRIDLQAVVNPRKNRRTAWASGLFGVWAFVGAVAAAIAGSWAVAALMLGTVLLSGMLCGLTVRAIRRMPATQRWLDNLSSRPGSA